MTSNVRPSSEAAAALPPHALAAIVPNQSDRELAGEASRMLGPLDVTRGKAQISVIDAAGMELKIDIPASVVRLVSSVLLEMALGNAVSLIPLNDEVTTQEAADILNVSRPYLVGLLEKGAMPFRKVGIQRRVRFHDVMDYKARSDADRRLALDALARQSQELRVGYDE